MNLRRFLPVGVLLVLRLPVFLGSLALLSPVIPLLVPVLLVKV